MTEISKIGTSADRLAYTINDFCNLHGISRSHYYVLQSNGKAPRAMKVGSRTYISCEAATDWRREAEIHALAA